MTQTLNAQSGTATEVMRAAVVAKFGAPLEVSDLELPTPGPGEALVKLETSGVCHTDLHAAHGDWPEGYPDDKRVAYDLATIKKWLEVFCRRFFGFAQFKRSAMPNGPKVVRGGSLSPRGDWRMPSDVSAKLWLDELKSRIHGAQQLVMAHRFQCQTGQRHRFQPAQHAQFGFRVAQAVEHHDAQQGFDIDLVARTTKDALKLIEAQFVPKLRQRPNVTERTGGFVDDGGWCRVGDRLASGACQTRNHLIELAVELVKPAQRGDGALLRLAVRITVGLDELQVAA